MSLLGVSARVVVRAPLLVPLGAALVLVLGTLPVLDDGYAMQVLRGVAVLLACACTATMDDPAGEMLAASPYSRLRRSCCRLVGGLALVVPAWLLALLLVHSRDNAAPLLGLSLEAMALAALGVAVAAGLRAWRTLYLPSVFAVPGVLVLVLALDRLPRGWGLLVYQTWGSPWQAAQIRWAALLLGCAAVVLLAWRDPLAAYHDRLGSALWTTLPARL